MPEIYDHVDQLPPHLLTHCREQPLPRRVLMCPPDWFEVVDVKNPFMEGNIGKVDATAARRQWDALKAAFERCGAAVDLIDPAEGCEDMVFCANQTLVGLDDEGGRLCVLSQMKHPSRQREVPHFARWFEQAGYAVEALPGEERFEGSGDAIWHPGRGLLWGGYGHRSEPAAYEAVSDFFSVPVIRLRLQSQTFYHLDTCFCPIDERTVLVNPQSLDAAGLEMIGTIFENVLEAPHDEAERGMACNAAALGGEHVVIDQRNPQTIRLLRDRGYTVHEVDTGEFLKSGGSVFCLKMYVF